MPKQAPTSANTIEAATPALPTEPLIVIEGDEQSRLDPELPDGGLPPAVGVQSWQVFRASVVARELTDGNGWTYHHHVDMARWRGRLYVGWNSCEHDEDVWPSRELYSTSTDGAAWSAPKELFPQGLSTPLRMYFYLAPNGRMLAIAGLRLDTADTREDRKGGLVVREIGADHALGPVFLLQRHAAAADEPPVHDRPAQSADLAGFESSDDDGFVQACRALLADRVYLEQQDRGRLLGRDRMKWHDAAAWPGGKVPGDNDKWVCGKAYSFFRRSDDLRIGISKMGWCTSSSDEGRTWSQPAVPPTLITGKAKVWSQRTADGRYALVYNPSAVHRYPLAIVSGDDGRTFSHMRIVQGELPRQRYRGMHRSVGPQYVRGLSEWSDDGSALEAADPALWLVYSMNKEDIWVSRVPLPVQAEGSGALEDDLSALPAGPAVGRWNTYAPRWGRCAIAAAPGGGNALLIESRDPYDYARAVRVFAPRQRLRVSAELIVPAASRPQPIEIDLLAHFGPSRPVRLAMAVDNRLMAADGSGVVAIAEIEPGRWFELAIEADARTGGFSVYLNGQRVLADARFAEPAQALQRISFRTGPHRDIGGAEPVDPVSDQPVDPTALLIRRLRDDA